MINCDKVCKSRTQKYKLNPVLYWHVISVFLGIGMQWMVDFPKFGHIFALCNNYVGYNSMHVRLIILLFLYFLFWRQRKIKRFNNHSCKLKGYPRNLSIFQGSQLPQLDVANHPQAGGCWKITSDTKLIYQTNSVSLWCATTLHRVQHFLSQCQVRLLL